MSFIGSLLETLYIEFTGTGRVVRQRERDHSGFTNVDDIDWDKL